MDRLQSILPPCRAKIPECCAFGQKSSKRPAGQQLPTALLYQCPPLQTLRDNSFVTCARLRSTCSSIALHTLPENLVQDRIQLITVIIHHKHNTS